MIYRLSLLLFTATTTTFAVEEGFTSLFNGKELKGWVGNTNGYATADGVLICETGKDNGGTIFAEREYGNFILRFEF
jgi:hypothetical protein